LKWQFECQSKHQHPISLNNSIFTPSKIPQIIFSVIRLEFSVCGTVKAFLSIVTHHRITEENSAVKSTKLIVGTTNNYAAISISIKAAAQGPKKALK